MNQNEIIVFDNLSKYYGQHIGIENLSFSIEQGDVFGFLGPNGAGKTTTIRLMLDLLKPSEGSIRVFGLDVGSQSLEIRKRIGYLPGDFTPFEKMTGSEFLKFSLNLRRSGIPLPENLFQLFELSKKELGKKIREYSQGMKQKIGIIHAVAVEPELIILDEPSTGLDPLMQDNLYELLLGMNKKGSTIFFSSHNLPEVEKICQKVAIVKEGKLVGFESLESLRKKKTKKVIIRLKSNPAKPPVLQGAQFIRHENNTFEYLVTGDLKGLLRSLSELPLEDIVFPEPNLEDIFLSYYEKEKLL